MRLMLDQFLWGHSSRVCDISCSIKDFSATTWVRILKFGTKLDSDELYCVTKEQPHIAYHSLYLFIFLSLQLKFLSQISQLLLEPVFANFVYIFRMANCTV